MFVHEKVSNMLLPRPHLNDYLIARLVCRFLAQQGGRGGGEDGWRFLFRRIGSLQNEKLQTEAVYFIQGLQTTQWKPQQAA
jgi:hypothetical protein